MQFWSASGFAHSLRNHSREQGLPWYVTSMLPIKYRWPESPRKRVLSPDTFVAFAPEHARSSYDVEVEGRPLLTPEQAETARQRAEAELQITKYAQQNPPKPRSVSNR